LTVEAKRHPGLQISSAARYELKYLLVSATTWSAVSDPEDRGPHAPHLVVLAMESVVHTRVLYEFLHHEEGWADRSPHSITQSELWATYKKPLHKKVLHPSPRRPYAPGKMVGDDLKYRVVDFATDILTMWRDVTGQVAMRSYKTTMISASNAAVVDATSSATWFELEPVFR
jgi:hypothetical protein